MKIFEYYPDRQGRPGKRIETDLETRGPAIVITADNILYSLTEYTASMTLDADDFLVIVDASSSEVTVTLPAAASYTSHVYTIKKIDSSGNAVTIDANGTETIDGEKTVTLGLQHQYVTIVSDGDEWFIIGGEYVKMDELLRSILVELKETKEAVQETNERLDKTIGG